MCGYVDSECWSGGGWHVCMMWSVDKEWVWGREQLVSGCGAKGRLYSNMNQGIEYR